MLVMKSATKNENAENNKENIFLIVVVAIDSKSNHRSLDQVLKYFYELLYPSEWGYLWCKLGLFIETSHPQERIQLPRKKV